MINRRRCYDPSRIFKPQWAYSVPAGTRPEVFLVPFTFQVPADGLIHPGYPWRLDDDVPYVMHGIVFPQIGTGQQIQPPPPIAPGGPLAGINYPVPALCRITDTQGNPLSPQSSAPVLALGVMSQSGFNSINAFGFPIEPAVLCSPGGVVLFDFQLSTNATPGYTTLTGVAESITVELAFFGTGPFTGPVALNLIDTGVPLTPLSITVGVIGITLTITVTLQDNGGGALVTTYAQLAAALNADPAVTAIASAYITGTNPNEILSTGVNAGDQQMLINANASTVVTVQGTIIGVKLFEDC